MATTEDSYVIRPADAAEISLMLDWAASEGWNPGLDDGPAFAAVDSGGFLIGELDGEPVASISVVKYNDGFGFLGFYIVRPDKRGLGLGIRLWRAGMERMGARNVGLDGVVTQQANYRKSGFKFAWNNVRYTGAGRFDMPKGLILASQAPFDELTAYDAAHFGCAREPFLRRWITPPAGRAVALVEDGTVAGYGVIRTCREGHKIGPLFAETPEAAEKLFQGLAASVAGEPFFLDIPEPNPEARALANRYQLEPVFETARMYTKGDPGILLSKIFGMTSFELG
jgi:ribosomal protein S18 acetylase RimI-like enzyme